MRLDIEGSFACTARMFCLAFAVALVGLQAAAEELPPGFSPGIKPTPPPRSDILSDQALKSFARALEAADRDQWATARRAAADTGNQTASAIILWRQLLHDDGGATFDEAIGFVRDYPDWPRLNIILSNAEALLPDEAPARALIAAFAGNEPITGKAKIQLAKAYLQENQDEAAAYWVRRAWAETDLGSKLESEVLADLSEFLRPEDHIARMEWMMWNGRTSATTRLLPILDPDSRAIARAWIALRNGAAVSQAVAGVPNDDRDHPGLIFEQVSRHRKQGNDQAAIDTLKRAVVIDKIGPHGDKWWKERNLLARSALDEKRCADAYDVVSNPGALSGEDFAEAEWLAGWISLGFLN